MPEEIELQKVYRGAVSFANSHYENFPVVSRFLPRRLKKYVAVVYRFARTADDIADEGNIPDKQRIVELNIYALNLKDALNGVYADNFWWAVADTIYTNGLTPKYFFDLIRAFRQDTIKKEYSTYDDLLGYCKFSANPVGRLMLEFFNIRSKESMSQSDAVCTALQITNFMQDVSVDYKNGRIYIPLEELVNFNVDEKIFETKVIDDTFKELMRFQIKRLRGLFNEGKKLLPKLQFMLRMQIKLTIAGGEKILEKIEKIDYNVLQIRPKLTKFDVILLVIKTLIK